MKTVGIREKPDPVRFDGFALDPARRQLTRDGGCCTSHRRRSICSCYSSIKLREWSVSRRHARIIVDGSGVRREDLGSKNGTKIVDRRVVGACSLRDGDVINAGTTRLLYRPAAAVGSTETVGPSSHYVSCFGCR